MYSAVHRFIYCVFVCDGTESQVTETLTFINIPVNWYHWPYHQCLIQMHYHHTHNYLIKKITMCQQCYHEPFTANCMSLCVSVCEAAASARQPWSRCSVFSFLSVLWAICLLGVYKPGESTQWSNEILVLQPFIHQLNCMTVHLENLSLF